MIIEWIINALIMIIKAPLSLLELPSVDFEAPAQYFVYFASNGIGILRLFFNSTCMFLLKISIGVMVLFKVVDLVSTVVGFFKKTD